MHFFYRILMGMYSLHKKTQQIFMIFFVFCSQPSSVDEAVDVTTTTVLNEQIIDEEEPELYVMLMWHQHQPFYEA